MTVVEVQQLAVIKGPDAKGVFGVLEEDAGSQSLHGIGHFPGESIKKHVDRSPSEDLIPEVEE